MSRSSGWHIGSMAGSGWTTLRQGIAAECRRRGTSAVVSGCIDLLEGREVNDGLILALGGPSAEYVLSGHEGGREGYWPRVWAARGLLHARAARSTLGG